MGGDKIDLNKYKHLPVEIEDRAELQSVPNIEGEVAIRMVNSFIERVDADIEATMNAGVSATSPDHIIQLGGDGYAHVVEDTILEFKRLLDTQKFPKTDRFMAVNASYMKDLLKIPNFIQQDRYSGNQAIRNGEIGQAYGFYIVQTENVIHPKAWRRSAFGFAMQQTVEFETQRSSLRRLATEYSLSALYGMKVLRGGIGIVVATQTGTI